MANERSGKADTRASGGVKPGRTAEDRPARRDADAERERRAPRAAGDASGEHGDRMPRGADEPGAGL